MLGAMLVVDLATPITLAASGEEIWTCTYPAPRGWPDRSPVIMRYRQRGDFMVEDKFPTEQYQILQNNEFELVATESSPQRPGARSIVINKRTGELLWSNLLACAQQSAARVHALRAAGLQILREIEGRPTRVIVDLETLLAEADGIERGLRGGFFEKAPPVPPRAAPRRTAEEERELQRTWEDVMRKIDEAVARTLAADAAAVAKSDDDEAA